MEKVMQMFYDREADVLYRSVGDPRPARSEEMGDDVLLRFDTDTGEVVGLTIITFASRFSSLNEPQTLPVAIDLRELART